MNGYLLDTHTILWLASNSSKLSERARIALLDTSSVKYVSIASAWEAALKIKLGKLEIEGGLETFFEICDENGLRMLGIKKSHIRQTMMLPFLHRDPFDRMLIATAQHESLMLLTADSSIHQYSVPWLW